MITRFAQVLVVFLALPLWAVGMGLIFLGAASFGIPWLLVTLVAGIVLSRHAYQKRWGWFPLSFCLGIVYTSSVPPLVLLWSFFAGGYTGVLVFISVAAAPLLAIAGAVWLDGRARFPQGHCDRCGYNLFGNTSGSCPECGAPLDPRLLAAIEKDTPDA